MPLRETLIFMQKACPTRHYEAGVLEFWSVGVMGRNRRYERFTGPSQYSNTPLLQVGKPYFLRLDIVVGINPIYLVRTCA
jgi:hypothetical protein